jgi:anti-anti-sigma factor
MNSTLCNASDLLVFAAGERGELTELVRGQEGRLLELMQPLVRRQCISLDLSTIQRIDAAGIAALITLYCDACKAGHNFTVTKASPRVAEILRLVGLGRIFLSQNVVPISHSGQCLEGTAA